MGGGAVGGSAGGCGGGGTGGNGGSVRCWQLCARQPHKSTSLASGGHVDHPPTGTGMLEIRSPSGCAAPGGKGTTCGAASPCCSSSSYIVRYVFSGSGHPGAFTAMCKKQLQIRTTTTGSGVRTA